MKLPPPSSLSKSEVPVAVFNSQDWDALSREQQKEYCSQNVVHLKRCTSDVLPDVLDASSIDGISQAIDLERPVYCCGKSPTLHSNPSI